MMKAWAYNLLILHNPQSPWYVKQNGVTQTTVCWVWDGTGDSKRGTVGWMGMQILEDLSSSQVHYRYADQLDQVSYIVPTATCVPVDVHDAIVQSVV